MGVSLETGIVTGLDYQTCRVRVRLDDRDGVETYWLHVPQRNTQGTQRRPVLYEVGEQVQVLLDDDGVGGTVLGAIFSDAEPPPVTDADTDYTRFRDGTVVTYDQAASVLLVHAVGQVNVIAQTINAQAESINAQAESVTVQATDVAITAESASVSATRSRITGAMGIEGEVTIDGNLRVNGNVDASGTVMDGGGNSNHHSH